MSFLKTLKFTDLIIVEYSKIKKCCSGLCVDLLRKFEEDLGFTYELTRVADPKWGTLEVKH